MQVLQIVLDEKLLQAVTVSLGHLGRGVTRLGSLPMAEMCAAIRFSLGGGKLALFEFHCFSGSHSGCWRRWSKVRELQAQVAGVGGIAHSGFEVDHSRAN